MGMPTSDVLLLRSSNMPHLFVDSLLLRGIERLRSCLRPPPCLFRWGTASGYVDHAYMEIILQRLK